MTRAPSNNYKSKRLAKIWCIVVCTILLELCFVESFQRVAFVTQKQNVRPSPLTRHFLATREKTNAATLTFTGEQTFATKPVPKVSPEKMCEFLQVDDYRNSLLSSGGKQEVKQVETTPDLLKLWISEAARMGADEPTDDDIILKVGTGGINFPGLKLVSVALIGSKLLQASPSSYPEYQFTLITDQRTAEGAPPVVWIYNKLTGSGKEDGSSSSSSSAHSLSRVTIGQSGDDHVDFSITSILEIGVNFPSLLLRLLPISKEKAEEQGSAAILKTLSKDTEASLGLFCESYKKWIEKN